MSNFFYLSQILAKFVTILRRRDFSVDFGRSLRVESKIDKKSIGRKNLRKFDKMFRKLEFT